MKVYSHIGIDKDIIQKKHEYFNDFGEITEFTVGYNEALVSNMPYKGVLENGTNAQGWLRDKNHYFAELLSKNPEYFSQHNIDRIKQKKSPYCDKVFTKYFPEYKQFIGNKLIHHHIGRDGQVVSVPQDIHIGQGGVHLVERMIGIDANAISFSNAVSVDVNMGNQFSWDKADMYVSEYSSLSNDFTDNKSGHQEAGYALGDEHFRENEHVESLRQRENQGANNPENRRSNQIPSKEIIDEKSGLKILDKGVQAVKRAALSPIGKKVIGGGALVAVVVVGAKTPQGRKFLSNVIKKVPLSKIGKKIPDGVVKSAVKATSKETGKKIVNKAVKEGTKEIARKSASEVGKEVVKEVIIKPMVGTPKAPHIRTGHFRKLASGVIIPVKEAIVHKNML